MGLQQSVQSSLSGAVSQSLEVWEVWEVWKSGKGHPSAEAFKPSNPYHVPSLEQEKKKKKSKEKQETILMTLINLILHTEL